MSMALALSYKNMNSNIIKYELNNSNKDKKIIFSKYNYNKKFYKNIVNKFYSIKK